MTTNRDSREKRLRHDTASTAPLDTYLVSGCRRDLEPRRCLVCVCAACPCLDLVHVGKGEKSKPHLASLTFAAAPVVAQFCIRRPSSDIFF